MSMRQLIGLSLLGLMCCLPPLARGQDGETSKNDERLQRIFQRNPDADANKDGVLTREEANAYREKMRAKQAPKDDAKKKQQAERPKPTHDEVKYGPHERNVLDFYQAKSDKPTPLIVYIHGGGFVGGNKDSFNPAMLRGAHDAGISFAAIHYRFVDGEKITFPVPQLDSARAVQFLRSKAREWNIDPERVVCYGGSAGAGISMWIGFHEDLAKPSSDDPVERQSTRIRAIGTLGGQGTYDPIKVKALIGGRAWEHPSLLKVHGIKTTEEALNPTPEVQKLYDLGSAITFLTKDDPPLFMIYSEPDIVPPPDARVGQFIHHPNFGKQLKKEMDKLGIENVYVHTADARGGDVQMRMLEFFKKHLLD